jgi:hypothetical protein
MEEGGSHVEGPMTLVLRAMVERSGSVVEVLQRAWGRVCLSVGGLRREDYQFPEVIFRRFGLRDGEIVLFDRAYVDFVYLHDLSGPGVHWVTRANSSPTLHTHPGNLSLQL